MNKAERIARYGEGAYAKILTLNRVRAETHPEETAALSREQSRKGGIRYDKYRKYNNAGLRKDRKRVRCTDQNRWRQYKRIIAPGSQIHHEWIQGTADYRGVALVEADQHMRGVVDVIEVLDGRITLMTEEEVRGGMTTW